MKTIALPFARIAHAGVWPSPALTISMASGAGGMNYWMHLSNLLLLVSYSVRDVLWLRCFAVAGAMIGLPYYFAQPNVLIPPIFWAVVFSVINVYQIARLLLQRRPIVLSQDEEQLYRLGLSTLRPRELASLAAVGEWRNASAGDQLINEGEIVSALHIAIAGEVVVTRHDVDIGRIAPGQIIGTALMLAGHRATVSCAFANDGRYIRWSLVDLHAFVEARPDLRSALQQLVNRDLARKIDLALA